MRTECPSCRRPVEGCVCDLVRSVDNQTGVTILQHPRERKHPFGTARLAGRSLRRVDVRVARATLDGRLELEERIPPGAALLYPGPEARELGSLDGDQRPRHLVVIDGTWAQAHQLYRDNPWLASLPQVRLTPEAPSAYRIRREPAPHCLSTVESIAAALRILEPDAEGLAHLLDGFTGLVDRQLVQLAARGGGGLRRRKHDRPPSALQVLAERRERLVVVYGEATPQRGRPGPSGRELLQWAAVRPVTGELFEGFALPVDGLPPDDVLARMGLRREALAAAPPLASLVAAWEAFTGPDDVLVTWSEDTSTLFCRTTRLSPRFVQLKSTWCNLDRAAPTGSLGDLVARLGLRAEPAGLTGRAALRVGNAVALAGHLGAMDGRR